MAVFSLACMLYTVLVGICFPENRQGVTTLFTDLHVQSLPFNWKHHCSHAGDDGTAASHNHRLGSVDATPRACAPGLHLVEQAVHVFTAQASAGGTSTTHSCRFGSVDATPGASAPGLHIGGQAVQAFAAKAVHDCQATAIPCRRGSVDATPGASAPALRSVRSAIAFVAQVRNAGAATTQAGRLEFVHTTPYVCAGSTSSSYTGSLGSVDATPGADDDGTVTETTRRLGSVDATPGAYAPDRRSVGPACAPAAQVIAAGTATTLAGRLVFVKAAPYVATAEATASPAGRRGSVATTPGADADGGHALCTEAPGTVPESKDSLAGRTVIPRRAGAGGYVDATPSLDAVVGAPCAQDQQLQEDRFVVATPPFFVPTSASPVHLSKVLCQPSLADRLRQGRGAVATLDGSLQVMPPRWPTGCNVMPARSELASALKPHTRATPLEHELGTPQHNTAPLRAMHKPDLSQVCLAAKLHTALADGVDQAGQLPACSPAVPGQNLLQLLWAYTGSFTRLDAAQLPACAGGLASPQLFVALHTAHVVVVFASAKMPSPSAKLKASRRLPKRLRVSGEQPTGDLARSRAEAAERYARGESNTEGQHSCHQGQRRSGDTATSHTRWQHAS